MMNIEYRSKKKRGGVIENMKNLKKKKRIHQICAINHREHGLQLIVATGGYIKELSKKISNKSSCRLLFAGIYYKGFLYVHSMFCWKWANYEYWNRGTPFSYERSCKNDFKLLKEKNMLFDE